MKWLEIMIYFICRVLMKWRRIIIQFGEISIQDKIGRIVVLRNARPEDSTDLKKYFNPGCLKKIAMSA